MTRCICSEFILIPQSRYHRLSVDLILENERACRKIADNWTPYICLAITTSGAWSKTGRCFIDSWMPYISNRRSLLCRCGSSFRFSLFCHVHLPFETLTQTDKQWYCSNLVLIDTDIGSCSRLSFNYDSHENSASTLPMLVLNCMHCIDLFDLVAHHLRQHVHLYTWHELDYSNLWGLTQIINGIALHFWRRQL